METAVFRHGPYLIKTPIDPVVIEKERPVKRG